MGYHLDLMERREFLKLLAGSIATLSLPAPSFAVESLKGGVLPLKSSGKDLHPAKANSVILIWLAGGMPHTDTFDPKKYQPFEKGVDSRKVISTFPTINTSVDNIKISAGLENIASVMHKGAIIRSLQGVDLGPVLHTRHQYHWHTGYIPPQTVHAPHLGAWISRVLGPKNNYAPLFVEIGQGFDFTGVEEVRAFFTGGFLGSEFSPLHIFDPKAAMQTLSPPRNLGKDGLKRRFEILKNIKERLNINEEISDHHRSSIYQSFERAEKLLFSPALKAFQLEDEPIESYKQYDTGRFGLGCLLARRLIEAGTRFVEVTSDYVPFGTWDTHKDGHARTVQLKKLVDQPIAKLISDLEERDLLKETLVIIASEFSRVAGRNPGKDKNNSSNMSIQNTTQYGLHRHFIGGASAVMFGGGVKVGQVVGETRDEFPCDVVGDTHSVSDFHATLYHLLGIPPDFGYEIEERPFYVTKDGKGRVIQGLVA